MKPDLLLAWQCRKDEILDMLFLSYPDYDNGRYSMIAIEGDHTNLPWPC
jgi:hypothetical protein